MKYINIEFFTENKKVIGQHLIFWSLFYLLDFIFIVIGGIGKINIFFYIINALFLISYFYIQIFVLYEPLKKGGFSLSFFIRLLSVYAITIIVKSISDHLFNINTSRLYQIDYFTYEIYRFTNFSFFVMAYLVYMKSFEEARAKELIERKLLQTEIAFLKAQINPHFLFNALNFVFEKVFDVSPKAANIILKLSDMMRYSVTGSKLDMIDVEKELEVIDDYLDIQRARFSDELYVQLNIEEAVNKFKIPPLILLSIIENSFKHGIANDPQRPIEINLVSQEKILIFICKNAIRNDFKDKATTAVGLENIERRLQVVFNDKYELIHTKQKDWYTVTLKIFY